MSIRRSHTKTSKKMKRYDIALRRSNGGFGARAMGRARWLKPSERRKIA